MEDGQDVVGVVLAEVRDCGPVTVLEVAKGVGVSLTTARRVLNYLEETGLVESDNYQRRARVFMPAQKEG